MRRLCAFATFVLLAFALPLFAQHGGGHASSGGGHGGSFGGHSSFSGGHSSFSAPRSNSSGASRAGYGAHSASGARSYAGSRGYAPAFHPPEHAYSANHSASVNRFDYAGRIDGARFRVRNRGFVGPWRYGYPGWYGYYNPYFYDPYWLGDSSSSYDDSQDQDVAQGYEMNGPGPQEQGPQDNYGENYNDGRDQDAYARSAPYEPRHAELTAPSAPTTLIFRDQHKEEIQNYAIVGNTLFSFSAERTQKIPLSDLDIPATTKVNEDRGVNFRVPGEGQ